MRAFLVAALLALASPASAQTIPGADAPAFEAARTQWLAGEDTPALTALAGLARAGNTAAQMLLAQIAQAPHTHAHVTADLPRAERIALLRREGGLSGRDWMEVAATADPLADAYWLSRRPEGDVQTAALRIGRLAASGDRRTALLELAQMGHAGAFDGMEVAARSFAPDLGSAGDFHLGTALFARSRFGQVRVPVEVQTPADFERYIQSLQTPQARLDATGIIDRDVAPMPELRAGLASTEVLDLIRTAPALAPLAGFCAATCPGHEDACVVSAYAALSPFFPEPLASPLPGLIPTAEYQSSARFPRDLAARLGTGDLAWQGCPG